MSEISPLSVKLVVVTRAAHQAATLKQLLTEQAAIPVDYPCLAIAVLEDTSALDEQLRNLYQIDTLILTSSNTIVSLDERLRALEIEVDWTRLRIAAIGPSTAAALLQRMGRRADFVPEAPSTRVLARTLPVAPGERIYLPQSGLAGAKTAEILRERGADVVLQVAYRTVNGSGGDDVPAMIERDAIDALTFASPSAVGFFRERCPHPAALALPAVGLGPATADKLTAYGFRRILSPDRPSLKLMVAALRDHFAAAE